MPKKSQNPIPDTLVTYNGVTQKLKHWIKELGLNRHTIYSRYERGDRGSRLLRPVEYYLSNPAYEITVTFNGKTRTLAQWAILRRVNVIPAVKRWQAGERDFYKLFGIKFDIPTISNTTTRT